MVKCHWCSENSIDGTMDIYSYMNIYNIVDKAHSLLMKKISSMGFLDFPNKYISNISNLYNQDVNMSLASQTKCDIMFSDTGFGSYIFTFLFSRLRIWFIFCFFLYVVIIHLLWRDEGVKIYCKLIPYWIESTRGQILFPA